jgi:RNA polymerase sigma-70 factor (ECF subfamily)
VRRAVGQDEKEAHRAMSDLCQAYWFPLYAYARRAGQGQEDAEDLVQAFFAKLLEKNYLEDADPGKGRLRTFLLTALKRYMAKDWRNRHALKRGGWAEVFSIDVDEAEESYRLEPADNTTPEDLYERQWVNSLLKAAIDKLRKNYADRGRGEVFDHMRDYLDSDGEESYAELGQRIGLNENAARAAVFRLRQQYKTALQEQIRETLDNPTDEALQEELGYLLGILGRQSDSRPVA